MNTYARWKYFALFCVVMIATLYALPNIYGEDPAVQIKPLSDADLDYTTLANIKATLNEHNIKFKSINNLGRDSLIRFANSELQLQAKDIIRAMLDEKYTVALNLAPVTPSWLASLGARPMKLGLDLRGGVRFLLEADIASAQERRIEADYVELRNSFRKQKIRYLNFNQQKNGLLQVVFSNSELQKQAYDYLIKNFSHLEVTRLTSDDNPALELRLSAKEVNDTRNNIMEQTVSTLRNRVNELGVAEAVVQRQGINRVVVELPGIQDTARAKDILGKTATIDFVMVDHSNDLNLALQTRVPPNSRILYDREERPFLLKKRVILTGDAITGASSGFDNRENRPAVNIRLGGSGIGLFRETTAKNIGKQMAVIYRETKIEDRMVDGKNVKQQKTKETVISAATIQSALGNNFQITGLDIEESRDLALLLRSGSLPAAISIVEERIVGPSMGQENIRMGMVSVAMGLSLVLFFMAIYYSLFGIIANLALIINLVLLVAIMSLLGATLTLPGIAGIVLTLGMAVDANVLIFERIREELRSGMSTKASIHRGFDHAFSTIVDANLTTLIVGIILFAVGTGPVKGFAVTLSIGIITSMFTAITGTRAIVNLIYGGNNERKLLVGI